MKRLLLTGGTGFIGHHVVEHILENTDWHIVILDGLTHAGDVGRLTDIETYDPKRVDLFWHDLRAPIGDHLDERIGHIDYVINMASESHVDRSITDPASFIQNNVSLVTNALEWTRSRGDSIQSFIQVSTDEVYGAAPPGYSHVEWDVIAPSNPYAASKAAQEAIAFSYWRTYGVPVVITNTMNNFGERQGGGKFIPVILNNLLAGEAVPVHAGHLGDGTWESGSRVWLHARNHADALLWILQNTVPSECTGGASRLDRYNVAGDRDIKNDELVEIIAGIIGVQPHIEYVDFHSTRPGHDLRYSLDGAKLRNLGWTPPVDFESAMRRTVEWSIKNPEWSK